MLTNTRTDFILHPKLREKRCMCAREITPPPLLPGVLGSKAVGSLQDSFLGAVEQQNDGAGCRGSRGEGPQDLKPNGDAGEIVGGA